MLGNTDILIPPTNELVWGEGPHTLAAPKPTGKWMIGLQLKVLLVYKSININRTLDTY